MADKVMTYEEFMEYAEQNYDQGGDACVECWGLYEFNEYVAQFGGITKKEAGEMFRLNKSIRDDRAGWL